MWYVCLFILQVTYSAENYIAYIRETLDKIKTNIPKAFVNLVQIFNIAPLARVSVDNIICAVVTGYESLC